MIDFNGNNSRSKGSIFVRAEKGKPGFIYLWSDKQKKE